MEAAQVRGREAVFAPVLRRYRAREVGTALLFLAPSLALFGLFTFWPLVRTFDLSFYGSDIIGRPTLFVGTRQYGQLLASPTLRDTLVATVLFAGMTVIPSLVLGLVLALLLQARIAAIGVFRTLMATPFAFSVATAAVVFAIFYNPGVGVFNGFLQLLHLRPVGWLTNPSAALPSVAIASVWLQLGYNVLVLSAGLQAIPDEIYEAARLDGARMLAMIRYVTLPLLTPSLFFLLVVTTIISLQSSARSTPDQRRARQQHDHAGLRDLLQLVRVREQQLRALLRDGGGAVRDRRRGYRRPVRVAGAEGVLPVSRSIRRGLSYLVLAAVTFVLLFPLLYAI